MAVISQPEFGRRLRQLRTERHMSQRDLAVGVVNPSYISLLESGHRVPTLEVVLQIAKALNVPVTELYSGPIVAGGSDSTRAEANRLVQDLLARGAIDVGDLDDAHARFHSAYQEAMRKGAVITALEYGLALAEVLAHCSDSTGRHKLATELLELAAGVAVPELAVKVRTHLASSARDTGLLAEAMEHAREALRDIDGSAFVQTVEHVQVYGVLISVLCDAGDHNAVPGHIAEMLTLAKEIASPAVQGRAQWVASVAFARIGDTDRALEHIRHAREMLANPGTSLRDWARFARAAASARLDADPDLSEVRPYMESARAAADAADLTTDTSVMISLEVRYALASGDPERAVALSETLSSEGLVGFELVRLQLAKGRALHRLGRLEEALVCMRAAARTCEEFAAFKLAALVWHELDDMRSQPS